MTPNVQRSLAEFKSQHSFQYAWFCAGPVVAVICGALMLRGVNWARWVFILWFGYNLASNIIRLPLRQLAPGLLIGVLFGAAVYLLFRPAAAAFFCGRALVTPQAPFTHEPPTS
jgi:hypothetical protein